MLKKTLICVTFCFIVLVNLNYAIEETTFGITIVSNITNQTTLPDFNSLYSYVLNTPYPSYYSSNEALNQTTYTINFTNDYPYQTQLIIFKKDNVISTECQSSYVNKQCVITYNESHLNTNYYLNYEICNAFDGCAVSPLSFIFSPGDYRQEIGFGIKIESRIMTSIPSATPIHYQTPPTPSNNQNSYQITNFTVILNLEEKTVDNCFITINNTNYSMTLNDTHCYYIFSFSEDNLSKQSFNFQAFYNKSGTITSLEKRTINIYPNKKKQGEYPAIDMLSYLFIVVILSLYSIIGGYSK